MKDQKQIEEQLEDFIEDFFCDAILDDWIDSAVARLRADPFCWDNLVRDCYDMIVARIAEDSDRAWAERAGEVFAFSSRLASQVEGRLRIALEAIEEVGD